MLDVWCVLLYLFVLMVIAIVDAIYSTTLSQSMESALWHFRGHFGC